MTRRERTGAIKQQNDYHGISRHQRVCIGIKVARDARIAPQSWRVNIANA